MFESDFVATSRLRALRSAPSSLGASAPSPIAAGPVALTASGGPANGIGVLAFAAAPAGGLGALVLPGFEQPLAWDTVLWAPPVAIVLPFDAAGSATFAFANPGFAPALPATAQLLFVSTANVLGATNALALSFTQ